MHKAGKICMVIGLLLIVAALGLLSYNYLDGKRAERASNEVLPLLKASMPEPELASNISGKAKTFFIDGYDYLGYLTIPALGLDLPVMADWNYERLRIAPCRYYGSLEEGNLVIAGHNYIRHFGRLSKLKISDDVFFTDMAGKVYTYKIESIEVLSPTATEKMVLSQWDLTLYTCTYGAANRLTIRCNRIES